MPAHPRLGGKLGVDTRFATSRSSGPCYRAPSFAFESLDVERPATSPRRSLDFGGRRRHAITLETRESPGQLEWGRVPARVTVAPQEATIVSADSRPRAADEWVGPFFRNRWRSDGLSAIATPLLSWTSCVNPPGEKCWVGRIAGVSRSAGRARMWTGGTSPGTPWRPPHADGAVRNGEDESPPGGSAGAKRYAPAAPAPPCG